MTQLGFFDSISQNGVQTALLDCQNPNIYKIYARCVLRDDIEPKIQIFYSVAFVICLAIFAKSCKSLLIIRSIYTRTPSSNMLKINILIFAGIIFQALFYLDGPLQLLFEVSIPLYLYLLFVHIALVILNTVLCIGGYAWITTVFAVMLYNKYQHWLKFAYWILLSMNFIIIVDFVVSYLSLQVQDNEIINDVSNHILTLDYILSALSTGINGIFFATACLMLRGYLKKNWHPSHGQEGLLLTRLIYVGLFIVGVRVLNNVLNIWQLPGDLKEYSVTHGNWWWVISSSIYLILENFLPTLYFLKKYEPNAKWKVNGETLASDTDGLLGKVIKSSVGKNTEYEQEEGILISSILTPESGDKEPLEQALIPNKNSKKWEMYLSFA